MRIFMRFLMDELTAYKNILRDIENWAVVDFNEDLLAFIKASKKVWLEDWKHLWQDLSNQQSKK